MSTSRERLQKVQALYDRAGTPGEKTAAFEALQRIKKTIGDWLSDVDRVLVRNGYYKFCWVGTSKFLYRKGRSWKSVEVHFNNENGHWIMYDREPDNNRRFRGTSHVELDNITS